MLVSLTDKVVIVTGSSKGIGKEIIRTLSKEGAKVVINYRNSYDEAHSLYKEIISYNSNCICVCADVTNPKGVNHLYNETLKKFDKIDALINNAGICDDNLIQLMPLAQWNNIINTNLTSTYLCSKIFSKYMIKNKCGKILNIASLKGIEGSEGQVNYCASKAGVIGFTKALAKELSKYNIAVNAICPGFVVTDMNRHNKEKQEIAKNRSLLDYRYALADLLQFITLMLSDKINGISGQIFQIDSRVK